MELKHKKVAKALGVRPTNIKRIKTVFNGIEIEVKNRQFAPMVGNKNSVFAHHSQIQKYSKQPLSQIIVGQEKELA